MNDYDIINPDPAALVQSMRSFGYDLPTALADIIDNSITAGAANIRVHAFWMGDKSYLQIEDDGLGMNAESLTEAMRPGTKKASTERDLNDLGRFGLGLKTASFSQCKKLTVVSKIAGSDAVARLWDLDYVSQTKEWRLVEPAVTEAYKRATESLSRQNSGTVVIWEEMDRWVGGMKTDSERDHRKLLEDLNHLELHIGMIFHRFIEQPNPVNFYVNGNKVKSWDPFLKKESYTQYLPKETLISGSYPISIQPYVLPHHSKISDAAHQAAGGISGWNAQQGFYLYRNKRMLMAGDWLGLGFQKEEHYKLARIQIDLPNTLDGNWSLDIKKSKITIPVDVREDLKRIAKITRAKASEVYRYRGKTAARAMSETIHFAWEKRMNRGKISYRINRKTPLIQALLENPDRKKVVTALDMLEETIPLDMIILDNNSMPSSQSVRFETANEEIVREAIVNIYDILKERGTTPEEARESLKIMDPFNDNPRAIAIIEELV